MSLIHCVCKPLVLKMGPTLSRRPSRVKRLVERFEGGADLRTEMDETQRILERARQREAELGKENSFSSDLLDDSMGVDHANMGTDEQPEANEETAKRRSSLYPSEELDEIRRDALRETNSAENINLKADLSSAQRTQHFTKAGLRSRFAALSAELENFECEQKPVQSKDAYINGASSRLSTGETRPSALFVPTASYYPTVKEVKQSPHGISKSSTTKLEVVHETPMDCGKEQIASDDEDKESSNKVGRSLSVSSATKTVSASVTAIRSAEKQTRFASPVCETKSFSSTAESSKSSLSSSAEEEKCILPSIEACVPDKDGSCNSLGHEIRKRESEEYGIHNFFKRKVPEKENIVLSEQERPVDMQVSVCFQFLLIPFKVFTDHQELKHLAGSSVALS
ncbi:unnamed protein product [Toxocara canis]|uniref:Claspin n=1 Tax=Toxocara canis TaxID=6265 RepID=A0A183UNC9_TOXCA|nr:unnamed protein product [Toxocara canis]